MLRRLESRIVWWLLIAMARRWSSRHMDQFETVSFGTRYGPVYLSLTRSTPYPENFGSVDRRTS